MKKSPTPESPNHEKEVRTAVEEFGQAFVNADVSRFHALLTDDYIHVNGRSGSILDKDKWLDWIKTQRTGIETSKLHIHEYQGKDITIKIYENVAIVTGAVYSSRIDKGEAFASQVRFTNTWILIGDKWLRASFHDSPIQTSADEDVKAP